MNKLHLDEKMVDRIMSSYGKFIHPEPLNTGCLVKLHTCTELLFGSCVTTFSKCVEWNQSNERSKFLEPKWEDRVASHQFYIKSQLAETLGEPSHSPQTAGCVFFLPHCFTILIKLYVFSECRLKQSIPSCAFFFYYKWMNNINDINSD